MKRWIHIVIATLVLLSCLGCANKKTEYVHPVNVYYCRDEVAFNSEDGVFYPEIREFAGYEQDLIYFMNLYLNGPGDNDLYAPFPTGAKILELDAGKNETRILLSTQFSLLSGYELTISCACISKTLMELTDCETVNFYIDGMQENESNEIVMSKDKLLLKDTTKNN